MLHTVEVQYKYLLVFCIPWSRNSLVDVVTRRSGFRIPAGVRDFSSIQKRPAWLWGLPSLLYNGYPLSLSPGVKRPGRVADCCPSSNEFISAGGIFARHLLSTLRALRVTNPVLRSSSSKKANTWLTVAEVNTLRTGSFKLFKRPLPEFLTISTL